MISISHDRCFMWFSTLSFEEVAVAAIVCFLLFHRSLPIAVELARQEPEFLHVCQSQYKRLDKTSTSLW